MTLLLPLLPIVALVARGVSAIPAPVARNGNVTRDASSVYSLSGVSVTTYYDAEWQTDGDVCAGTWGSGWSANQNQGIPTCEWNLPGDGAPSLADLATNRIVAMNRDWLEGDLAAYCGKEVQILKADGTVFEFSEGSLVLWDGCAACASASIVDLSAPAWTALTGSSGGECGKLGTFTVNVLNNQVWQPVTNGQWAGPNGKTYGSGSTGGGSSATVSPPVTTSTAPVTSPSTPGSLVASVCQAGVNQCNGAEVQICDYVSNANGGVLGWKTTATCTTSCIMSGTAALCS